MIEMKNNTIPRSGGWQMVLIALTILFAIIAGVSFLAISSPYAPLFLLASMIALIAVFTWLRKPIFALYFTLFTVFLPTSLIPAQVNSYLNRIATVCALVVWVIDIIRRQRRILLPTSTLLMMFFIVWAALSLLWADDLSEGITVLQQYVLRLLLFLVLLINEIKTKKDLDGLLNTLALSGGVLVIVSVVTIFLQGYSAGTRLQVLDVNENTLGLSLLITTPAVLWWAVRPMGKNSAIKKWLAAIFLLATIGLIGLSGSRGSAISLGITLLAFLIWKPTRSWGILGLFIIGLAIIVMPIIFSTTISRFLLTAGESILGGREVLWPAGWQLIKDHLIWGVGIGNSSLQVIPYLANLGIFVIFTDYEPLHNPVMVLWAETGLPGLILYLCVLVTAVVSFIRNYLYMRRIGNQYLMPYFALIASVFIGFMASWIKGGGMETEFSYFLMLAMLLIPSTIQIGNT